MHTLTLKILRPRWLVAALALTGALGCDNDPATPAASLDAADAAFDIGQGDSAADTSADSSADVASDSAADTIADTAIDAVIDSAIDTAADSGVDAASPALFACASDLDCTAIETQCCDHCNGGKALAVAKASLSEAKALFGPGDCSGVACTEMACSPSKVLCKNKTCALIATPSECSKLGAADCAQTEGCMALQASLQTCDGKPTSKTFLGCTGQKGCATVMTCATDPSGAKYLFPDSCLPPGFAATGSSDCCAKPSCTPAPAAKLCIRGKPVADGEEIAAGDPVQVQVYPKGCFSSSCTQQDVAKCSLMPGDLTTFVQAEFCLSNTGGSGGCTADCGGGGVASCGGGTWSVGEWPFALGSAVVSVTVPSKLPLGGKCVGSQF